MYSQQNWIFVIRGREVIVRVDADIDGAAVIRRYSVTSGPSQVDLAINVSSRAEAHSKIEELLSLLLGKSW